MERPVPFISRVRLKNYRSIADCDVRLGRLTVLVGPNGSGKSNFLQALALLSRAVNTTPYEAITTFGGLEEILRRAPEPAESFSIDVEATVPWSPGSDQLGSARYGFEVGIAPRRGLRSFEVRRESCELTFGRTWKFSVERGAVHMEPPTESARRIEPDRLYLPIAASQITFGPLFQSLTNMQFYNFSLDVLREPSPFSGAAVMDHRGEHFSEALRAIAGVRPDLKDRVDAYLKAVVPGIEGIYRYSVGGYETVAFRAGSGAREIEFGAAAISDGTIRAAAVLTALFQLAVTDGRIPLVGIEEPELALHPAAAGVLLDALTEASERTQVLVTTQSPDLLDRDDLDVSAVRAVSMEDSVTVIGEVDRASRQIVKDRLYTLGELMRGNQLTPEPGA